MGLGYGNNSIVTTTSTVGVWAIISVIIAICASIVIYFTFLNKDNEKKYTGFLKSLYDFLSFKTLTLEAILKIFYMFIAIYITLASFELIKVSIIAFVLMLIIGNVVARIVFESALLLLMIYRQLVKISDSKK